MKKLNLLKKYIWIIIAFSIVGVASGYFYAYFQDSKYTSLSTVYIEDEKLENYVYYIKTTNILSQVDSDISVSKLYDSIIVKIIDNTNLMEITVLSDNPIDAQRINNELVRVFTDNMMATYNKSIIVIEPATLNYNLERVNENTIMLYGLLAGLFVSVSLILLFGNNDVKIKNHNDLKKYLNIKSLGIIPNFMGDEDIKKKTGVSGNASNIILLRNPNSVISESYRMIRTNLDFLDIKVINFTSTTAGEGKSGTIANIALSFACCGKRVLLIDCDLRKPVVHKMFEVNRTLGISDILVYNRVSEYKLMVQNFKIPNTEYSLDILSAGSKVSNPSELLNGSSFDDLIETARDDYDLVLIDCPPTSLMTDASVVSKKADGTVYVIEYNNLNDSKIKDGIDTLTSIDAYVIGGILNKVNINKQKHLYGNKNDYYNQYI